MSDLIDRAAAQTALMGKCERYTLARESHGMGHVEWSDELIDLSDAMDAIRDLPPAQPEPKWIPCSELLPFAEYGESPNVYCYCHDVERGGRWAEMLYFNGGVWCKPTGETFGYKVLAWYPLPKNHIEVNKMSVIVKGMEMPEKCQYCCLLRYYHENGNVWCNANNALLRQGWYTEIDIKRPETCPLVEIPEKHGRLIEEPTSFSYGGLAYIHPNDGMGIAEYFAKQVKAQPTILEAEEQE